MFEVVEKWANRDSEKSRVVGVFNSHEAATKEAQHKKEAQRFPWSGFVVRPVTPNEQS